MNILLITNQGDIAGATNSISYLARGLSGKGHTVVVGCRQESLLFQILKDTSVILEPMTFKHKYGFDNIKQIAFVVKKYKIELINSQASRDRYSSVFSNWFKRLNCVVVHTRRQTPRSSFDPLKKLMYLRGTHKFVVVSSELKKTFIKKGIPDKHIEVIFNGIPTEFYKNADEEKTTQLRNYYKIGKSEKVIGCVSRMKKQEQLIQALQYLPDNITVFFAGIKEGSLDDLVQSLNIKQRIIYAGEVKRDHIVNYYKLFDVNVLPSITDGFGLVLVEAMGMGVPVIGTDAEGIKDVITDGVDGFLFTNEDTQMLAEKLQTILFNTEIRKKFIANGMKTAHEKFVISKTIENYEKLFQRLINQNNT